MGLIFGHSTRWATPQTLSTINSYCPKHDPSMLDHYLISTSWCPCIACICSGLHGNFPHVSTQMDSILQAARHIVLERLQVDSMFSSHLNQWWLCSPPPRGDTDNDLSHPSRQMLSLISWNQIHFFVVLFREKIFLWHLKLVFPQSSTEFSQRRWVPGQHLDGCEWGHSALCWQK